MEIKDDLGKYVLTIDTSRNIVCEVLMGYWKAEDLKRFHEEYILKIIPIFQGKPWAKLCDLRAYHTSMITDDIKKHIHEAVRGGFSKAAIILDPSNKYASVVEMQMRQCAKDTPLIVEKFTNHGDADRWLR